MLYFAYGSNLWRQQMAARCPESCELGSGRLNGWRWIITRRGYASIVRSAADYVLGTVFEVSTVDSAALDRFEGVANGHYRKEMVRVELAGCNVNCFVYVDPVSEEGVPKEEYISRINHGLQDAAFPEQYVTSYLRPFIPERSPL